MNQPHPSSDAAERRRMRYVKPLHLFKEVLKRKPYSERFPSMIALNFCEDRGVSMSTWGPTYSEPIDLGFRSDNEHILAVEVSELVKVMGLVFGYPTSDTNVAKMKMFIDILEKRGNFGHFKYTFWNPKLTFKNNKYGFLFDPIPPRPEASACKMLEGYLNCGRMNVECPIILKECE
ncbi:hypothetical protein Q3G72_032667 [Acer saccharum]|nr:hypothetical protein Q3G72_032667 [Acer saccharum]